MGCDVFIDELIPHIDATYRTVAERGGRGIEGFSQGAASRGRACHSGPISTERAERYIRS
jgi:hypothetical protein